MVDEVVVGEAGLFRLVEHEDDQVVHEVLADAGEVDEGGDAVLGQLGRGADARAVEDVGAAVGAAADDDLLASLNLDDGAVGPDGSDARGLELAGLVLFNDDLVNVSLDQEVDVVLLRLGDKVGTSGTETLVDCSGSMTAAVGVVAV